MTKFDKENMDHNTASLIYFWLKENKLVKTCKTLQEEYGNSSISKKPKDASSLNKVIETYHAMSVLMSAFLPNNNNATTNTRKRKLSTSSKTSETDATQKSNNENKYLDNVEGKSKKSKKPLPKIVFKQSDSPEHEEGHVLEVPKKKKEPFVQPGEWICPEMESILGRLFDRLPKSALAEFKDKAKPEVAVVNKIDGTESIIPQIDSNVKKETAKSSEGEDDAMFTSDSEQDSDDETNLKKTINESLKEEPKKLSKNKHRRNKKLLSKQPAIFGENGTEKTKSEVDFNIEPPTIINTPKKKKKSKTVPVEMAEETPITKEVIEKKNSDVLEDESISISPNLQSTVKKKKKKNKPKLEDMGIDESIVSNQSIVSNAVDATVISVEAKKKKKKKKTETIYEENETVVDVPVVDDIVEPSPKKKKTETIYEENETVVDVPVVDNIVEPSPKKKKKKIKLENTNLETVTTNDIVKTGDDTLNNLGDLLKKKKKKKIVDRGA